MVRLLASLLRETRAQIDYRISGSLLGRLWQEGVRTDSLYRRRDALALRYSWRQSDRRMDTTGLSVRAKSMRWLDVNTLTSELTIDLHEPA